MTVVEFLRARLDEDEQAARGATPGPWSYNPGKMWLDGKAFETFDRSQGEEYVAHGGPSPFTGCVAATGPASHSQSMADAAFIARHDPARVLAEVEAKRRIVEEHAMGTIYAFVREGPYCTADDQVYPCRTLRLLALPHAAHPDYDEAWRP
jgi:hypothetical protein